jgi:hypothetical protein
MYGGQRTKFRLGKSLARFYCKPMTRYFFHILHSDSQPVLDDEGAEFEDIEMAKSEAIASLRDLAADAVKHGKKVTGLAIQVTDAGGTITETVTTKEIFD